MGGGPEAALPLFQKAQEKYQSYQNDTPFWPAWGEDVVRAELDRLEE